MIGLNQVIRQGNNCFADGNVLIGLFQFYLFDPWEAENFLMHVSIGPDVSIPEVKMEGELSFPKISFNPKPGYFKLIFLDDRPDPVDLTPITFSCTGN